MSENIRDFYDKNFLNELNRLNDPYNRIEFFSTLYMIKKYFPEGGQVFDIGSGPGKYSLELLKKNYKVSLMDISENSIILAKNIIEANGLKAEKYICGDAINLEAEKDESYDAILLLGPLHHLKDRADRKKILDECRRILKKDGIILLSYLNSYGILKLGVSEFFHEFHDIENIYKYFNEDKHGEEISSDFYYITPTEAMREISNSNLDIESYAGAESFLSGLSNVVTRHYVNNKKVYFNLLKTATEKCEMKEYRDSAEHLLFVCRKK